MNILYFIRLLLKNYLLLIIGPIIVFAIIFNATKDEPKVYTSFSEIYTGIATGSSLTALEEEKSDRFGTMMAFDNLINIIKSRGTAEEVGLKLFTNHMILEGPKVEMINAESYAKLMKIVPQEVKDLVVKGDFNKTYKAFLDYKRSNNSNFIYKLILLNHPDYSYEKILGKLKVKRINSSDMIEIRYSSEDQGICLLTLKLVNEVFIQKYSEVKLNQSDAILRYFQQQLNDAQRKLDKSEDELLQFNKDNRIINYYEQTQHITMQKERFASYMNELKMENAAVTSVLKVLENKLTTQQKKEINNQEIIDLRNELADINLSISMKMYQAQFDTIQSESLNKEISELNVESYKLQDKLRNTIDQSYFIDNSVDGLGSSNVISEWLDKVIELESTKAKLIAGRQKQIEFENVIEEYAPKGAQMKRLERKIDIAEREYLSILHSLNVAKLKQQNLELNSNIKVSEPPFFPLKSSPSKRKFMLLVGLMVGFIVPAFLIIVFDFLNSNIKNIIKAETVSHLEVTAAYPNLVQKNKRIDYEFLKQAASNKLSQRFLVLNSNVQQDKPQIIINSSIQEGEGKSTLTEALADNLSQSGFKTLRLNPEIQNTNIEQPEDAQETTSENTKIDAALYEVNNKFYTSKQVSDLQLKSDKTNIEDYDFVFLEIPALIQQKFPVALLNSANHVFLTLRANRSWNASDKSILKDLLKITKKNKPTILLNGIELDEFEKEIGEIPGKRSMLRNLLKKIILIQFHSKKKIK